MRTLQRLATLSLFLFLLALVATTVQAEGVVGDGTPGSCTEAALDAALSDGGTVTFNCGQSPHTIILTSQKSINNDTTIEGGNLITLSGANSTRLFDVGAVLILRDIVLTNGYFNGDGGAIRNNANGDLTLDNVTLQNSSATLSGGAIVSYGPLNILDSTLTGNSAGYGGALYLRFSGSQTNIVNSTLNNNQSTDDLTYFVGGGAILVWDGASLTIQGSLVNDNSARLDGGGIYATDNTTILVEESMLSGNQGYLGGGIANHGTLTINRSTFKENGAGNAAGLFNGEGRAFLTDVTFSGNIATYGGAMENFGATSYLTNVTFDKNISFEYGGGIYDAAALTTMTNVTFSENIARLGGGLYSDTSISSLTNVTFSDNYASVEGGGDGIYYKAMDPSNKLTLKNTLLANDVGGEDCAVASASINNITSAGYNIASNNSCNAYFTQPTDQTNVDPLLDPLAANGGFTWTHDLQNGSPAIDKAQCLTQVPTDQRGVARPQGVGCDIGAVERKTLENVVYLPMVVQ